MFTTILKQKGFLVGGPLAIFDLLPNFQTLEITTEKK